MQTNETDFETHVDDIVKAVGDKLERNVIVSELKRYVDEYGIDLATAKESIVRKHYGNPGALQRSEEHTSEQCQFQGQTGLRVPQGNNYQGRHTESDFRR